MKLNLGSHDYVQTLKGQKLRFPDFDGLIKGFPAGISPHYELLKQINDAELKILLGPGPRYDALVACDCALNACTWWPNASFDALRLNAHFVAFLYVWDNEQDSPEFSNLAFDLEAGDKFRAATVEHVKKYLSQERSQSSIKFSDVHTAIASFNPVGETAGFRLNQGQRKLFMDECIRYILACGDEQRSELSGEAPNIKQYLPVRLGTSGGGAIASLTEYMVDIDLGDEIRDDEDMASYREMVNMFICITNDAFSLRKELMFPFYNNAVAVLYNEYGDLSAAIGATYKIVADGVKEMAAIERRVFARYPERHCDLQKYFDGAKGACSGSVEWSRLNKRYNLGVQKFDGTTEITI